MTKKERKRLLIGTLVMAVIFFSVALIGWTQDEFVINYFYLCIQPKKATNPKK